MKDQHQPTAVARLLTSLRQAVGLTQYEAARRAGIDRTTLLRIERGEHQPGTDTLNALARVLRVEPEMLYDTVWNQSREPLPSLPTYFRHRYRLGGEQIAEMERALARVTRRDPRTKPRQAKQRKQPNERRSP